MSSAILQFSDIEYSIGNTKLFSNLNVNINYGEKICIVGRNGSGKTTLLRLIMEEITQDNGEYFLQPGTKITYMPQEPKAPENDVTIMDYICKGVASEIRGQKEAKAKMLLGEMGIDYNNTDIKTTSGGELRKITLIKALIQEPDILMLDEPTNHLDIKAIGWVERHIKDFKGTVILISHDRKFLENTTRVTLWLDRGKVRRLNKGYKYFDEWSNKLLEEECKAQIKLDKIIEQETKWSHTGVTARRKRNQGRLRKLHDLRQKKANQIKSLKLSRIEASTRENISKSVIETKNISKSYGEKELIKNFNIMVTHGEKIGIIGPNGCGKTTLLRMLIGEEKPDSGKIKIAKNLNLTYMDQKRTVLNPKRTLWETLCPNGGDFVNVQGKTRHVVAYLKDFMFDPDSIRSPVGVLSGGEKNRLLLALSLTKESNLLVLDEPTNDLDMDTLDRLQDMVFNYQGTAIIVSHDRAFLDSVVTSTIVFDEDDKSIIEYAGGYSDYLIQKENKNKKFNKKTEKTKAEQNTSCQKADKHEPRIPLTKLSFKDQFELKEIPKKIEMIDNQIKEIETQLFNPDIYQEDQDIAKSLNDDLNNLKIQKEDIENRWLELELMVEEIEKNKK